MSSGQVRYALVTNDDGGILDDVLVYRLEDSGNDPIYRLVVNASNRQKIWDWIVAHRGASDADGMDVTAGTAMIAVQGPRALEIVAPLVSLDLQSLRYYHCAGAQLGDKSALVSRTGYTGEDGCELVVSASIAVELWEKLIGAAQACGGMAAGLGARDTLRLEAAMPLYGHELDESIDPFQAGLGFAVDLEGRQFPGRDALARLRDASGRPRRVGWQLSGRRAAARRLPGVRRRPRSRPRHQRHRFTHARRPIAMGYVAPSSVPPAARSRSTSAAARAGHGRQASVLQTSEISELVTRGPTAVQQQDLLYAKTHEWVHVDRDSAGKKVATIGISHVAVEALTDLVFLELPEVGRQLKAGESFGEVESVKAVSDLYSPVSGEIVEINGPLPNKLEQLHDDPYGAGWIIKVRLADESELKNLMDYKTYQKQVAEEGH